MPSEQETLNILKTRKDKGKTELPESLKPETLAEKRKVESYSTVCRENFRNLLFELSDEQE